MSRITGYVIVADVANSINSYLDDGWELYGEPFLKRENEDIEFIYQAMVCRQYGIIRRLLRFLFNWIW
jgi:hypothetical protein